MWMSWSSTSWTLRPRCCTSPVGPPLLRQRGVRLISVQEHLEETASGRLVEGIHALMAEFYSANLSTEVKKGMRKKVQLGGWNHRAPLGYMKCQGTSGRPAHLHGGGRPAAGTAHH